MEINGFRSVCTVRNPIYVYTGKEIQTITSVMAIFILFFVCQVNFFFGGGGGWVRTLGSVNLSSSYREMITWVM